MRLTTTTTLPVNGSGVAQTRSETRNPLGEMTQVVEANGITVDFSYWATGELRRVDTADGVLTMSFDALGRKIAQVDPDLGAWSYVYNAAGELLAQRGARGSCTDFRYDGNGRTYRRRDYAAATLSSTGECTGGSDATHTPGFTSGT